MGIQSILFDNRVWTLLAAHKWLMKNNIFPKKSAHMTKNHIRFRIEDPEKYQRFRTKKLDNGIDLVFGFK